MRHKSLVVSVLCAAIVAGPALAEEVIHFTNGTVLPIRSHTIEGDQVKIDLGDNGFMAFPKSVVAKIEDAPGVTLLPSSGPNRMFQSRGGSTNVRAANSRQMPGNTWALPVNEGTSGANGGGAAYSPRTQGGVPVKQALPNDPNPSARKLQVIDRAAMRDTAHAAQRRAAGANRVSLPNSTIKTPKTRVPLTKKK